VKPASVATASASITSHGAELRPNLSPNTTCAAPFDGGIEIRVAQKDKGDAVRSIIKEMEPSVAMAYLGDDTTDEDAFGALTRRGLCVLVRDCYRPTIADAWIRPPEGLLAFLRGWLSACPPHEQLPA